MKTQIIEIVHIRLIFAIIVTLLASSESYAQNRTNVLEYNTDPRGKPELTLCSQNLENLGELKDVVRRVPKATKSSLAQKQEALVKRFLEVNCDVIAVQEVIAPTEERAKLVLESLASDLYFRTNRKFKVYVGPSNDKSSRVGYIVAEERATFNGLSSYVAVELPRITDTQKPRNFARGPLELRLIIQPRNDSKARDITLVTFHFKSKAFSSGDGASLEWETYRMEMAEALRRIVQTRHSEALKGNGSLFVLLGDRNSHYDTASAKILTGELELSRFQGEAPCRLSKRGVPLCQPGMSSPPLLYSVLTNDPQVRLTAGTYVYNNIFSWIDDILVSSSSLPFALHTLGQEGDYDSGTVSLYPEASDHSLVWVRFNW